MKTVDLLIIGGGPAGLAAAISAKKEGVEDILLIERNETLGGILNQCIHHGFGVHVYKEELTGPEFAHRLASEFRELNITAKLNSMVLEITKDKVVSIINDEGLTKIQAKAIILAMGCRERPRGAINIAGSRGAGIFSAGAAQKFVNMEGQNIGNEVVILGSGDIGLIMARRLTFEGAKVKAVVELMPYSSGLARNIKQCVEDFDIPLMYNTTVTKIVGKERVEGVYISSVDENKNPIKETEKFIKCDTLLLSVGLIPENDLVKELDIKMSRLTSGAVVDNNMQTTVDGIFACGNVLHVHDLVDNVVKESYQAGKYAALFIKGSKSNDVVYTDVSPKGGVRYVVPNKIDVKNYDDIDFKFRVYDVYKNCVVNVYNGDEIIKTFKKKILTPGEMEQITVKKDLLNLFENKNVFIEVI